MSLNCTVLQASKLVSRNTDEHTACLLALLTVLNWCGAIQHNAHGPRSPRSGAARARFNTTRAHNLRTPKHGSRNRNGRRRGRHTTCYYTGR